MRAAPVPALTVTGSSITVGDVDHWRGIGVNVFDLRDKGNVYSIFKTLREYSIPFVRFSAGGYDAGGSPLAGWRRYLNDKAGWYAVLDSIVLAAEQFGIGLVPSMFWRYQTIPDLMQYLHGKRDAVDQWGVADSRSRQFMRAYTAEFVSRYKDRSCIWGWEIGNEYFTFAERYDRRPPTVGGASGGPSEYLTTVDPASATGVSDVITHAAVKAMMSDWAQVVLSLDTSGRLLSTGNSISETNVYNSYYQSPGGGPTEGMPDDTEEWMEGSPDGGPWPAYQTPPEFNSICAHIYQQARMPYWFFDDGTPQGVGVPGLISLVQSITQVAGKAFFLGEFGSAPNHPGQDGKGGTDPSPEAAATYFYETLDGIVAAGVPMAAVWVYDAAVSPAVDSFNIHPGSGREYQLEAIRDVNIALGAVAFRH